MAAQQLMKIPRQSDRSVIEFFRGLAAEWGIPQISLGLGVAGNIQVPSEGENPEQVNLLLDVDSSLIETASVTIQGLSIHFFRGGRPTQNPPVKSGVFDDIEFNVHAPQCTLSETQRLQIIGKAAKQFGPFDPQRTVPGVLTDDQQQLLAIHNSTLERLQALNEELIRGSEEFRRNLQTDFQRRSDELEGDFRNRLDGLDKDFEKRKASLDERDESIAKKLKEIDDRQNTHVRREIRKDILEEIRSRSREFKLTEGTNRLRLPVHAVCLVLLGVLGVASAFFAKELADLIKIDAAFSTGIGILAAKQILVSAAFGATAVFYIRWLNAWSSEHAEAEFKLRQFQLDIERASWVVETSLEWKDARDGAIPSELLEPISRNLFSDQKDRKPEIHPADELASALLGTAAKVRLRAGDSELELDGKRLARAN